MLSTTQAKSEDWICRDCQARNFGTRSHCYQCTLQRGRTTDRHPPSSHHHHHHQNHNHRGSNSGPKLRGYNNNNNNNNRSRNNTRQNGRMGNSSSLKPAMTASGALSAHAPAWTATASTARTFVPKTKSSTSSSSSSSSAEVEYREDFTDGQFYTEQQFLHYYGNLKAWTAAAQTATRRLPTANR